MTLVATRMQNLRSQYQGDLDKNTTRLSRYGAWDLFLRQNQSPQGILSDDARQLIKRSFLNSNVQVPVLNAPDVSISNARSCTISDSENTSALVTLTFVTYAFGFTMIPAQYPDNEIGYQADFDKKLKNYLLKLAATLDTAALSALDTNKNQVWTDIGALFSGDETTADIVEVGTGEVDFMYNNLDAMMEKMDFYAGPENYDVVADTLHKATVRRLAAQGPTNDENNEFQFQNFNFSYSNRVTNAAGAKETGYVVAPGSLAVENRNDWDAVLGHTIGTQKQWEIVQNVPIVGLDMAAFYTEDCADKNALHSGTDPLTRTKVEGYEWSTDVAFVTAYNPDLSTNYNPIVKFNLATS